MKFDRYTKYQGHGNEKIRALDSLISNLKQQQAEAQIEIDKIQSDCDHDYKFVCSGMYEDFYRCILCGHEREH